MTRIGFDRHFSLLAGASVVLFALFRWQPEALSDYHFGVFGVLHALSVLGALHTPRSIPQSVLFITAGAVLSVGAYVFGLFGAAVTLTFGFALGSAFGAFTYGAVIRLLFLPHLTIASLIFIATGCAAATAIALLVASDTWTSIATLTLVWWWTFSGLLWSQVQRRWRLTTRWSRP